MSRLPCSLAAVLVAIAAAAGGPLVASAQSRPPDRSPAGQARERRPDDGQARERRPEDRPQARPREAPRPAPRPAPRVTKRGGSIVFVGGYYYDPFFGPYPWWPRPAYPVWYYPRFDYRAEVRIDCRERAAAVYVDGFYAGIVDDFDGLFQRLPLPPGGHRLTLFLDGFETADFSVYLRPGTTFTVRHAMMRLAPGEVSRRPTVAAPVPAPPDGTYRSPGTRAPLPPDPASPSPASGADGTLELHVQPPQAEVRVNGERWISSGDGAYELQLPAGRHRLEVSAPGYRAYDGDVEVLDGEVTPVHVTLTRERGR